MWLIALFGVLFWAQLISQLRRRLQSTGLSPYPVVGSFSGQPEVGSGGIDCEGEALYGLYCVACHQANGLGTPGGFTLGWLGMVLAPNPARLIRILLHGPPPIQS